MTDKLRSAIRRAHKLLDDDGYVLREIDGRLVVDEPNKPVP